MNMNTDNRVSPQAPEIEEAILGACLIEREAMPLVADTLRPEMFYSMRHQVIYAALLAMYQAGMKIDILTVKEELAHRGKLEEAGGAFGITQLSSKVATSAHIEYHMQIVHEKYLRREMILGLNKLLACSLDETMDIADTLIDAHNLLDRLEGEFGHNDHMRDMDALMTDTMEEAEQRIAKSVNGITGIPNPHEVAEAHTTAAELARLPIHVDDSTSISMDHVRSSARLLKSKSACDLIIIDYLQLCDMNTGQKNRNREQEVAQATRKAKLLAKELNVPVVLLCQLNRESEGRPGGRPELFHLRESGAIEQDADVVMLLYRPALARLTTDRESGYPTEGLGVVIVAKQRNGETGNAYFSHNPSLTKITDYTPPLEVLLKQAK